MRYEYTSLEDGQVITTDEPREDLDELARWVRSDITDIEPSPGLVPSRTEPVAGPLNTAAVTGGDPPLLSATAGVANPAEELSTEAAAAQAAKDLNDGVPPLAEQPPHVPNTVAPSAPADAAGALERPGLNGSTEEWLRYVRQPSVDVDVPDDAGREAIIAAYLEKVTPSGNASREAWEDFAKEHGIEAADKKRDEIRDAVAAAGWAKP